MKNRHVDQQVISLVEGTFREQIASTTPTALDQEL
jgi:hypothetical protein